MEAQIKENKLINGSFSYLTPNLVFPENNCVNFEPPPVGSMKEKYKKIMWETYEGILTQQEIDTAIEEAIRSHREDSIG